MKEGATEMILTIRRALGTLMNGEGTEMNMMTEEGLKMTEEEMHMMTEEGMEMITEATEKIT